MKCRNSRYFRMFIYNIIKKTFRGIVCRDIKTEKAQKQVWDGTLASNVFANNHKPKNAFLSEYKTTKVYSKNEYIQRNIDYEKNIEACAAVEGRLHYQCHQAITTSLVATLIIARLLTSIHTLLHQRQVSSSIHFPA